MFTRAFRPLGESLFLLQPKQSNQKKAATTTTPLHKNAEVSIQTPPPPCCEKTRMKLLKQFSQKTHGNSNVLMACLRWGNSKDKHEKGDRSFLLFK